MQKCANLVELQKPFKESENSWRVEIKDVDQTTFDLSVKNPNKKEEAALREPEEIMKEIKALDEQSADILKVISEML